MVCDGYMQGFGKIGGFVYEKKATGKVLFLSMMDRAALIDMID